MVSDDSNTYWRGLELRANEQVKAARDALEKRCELQIETIRELRAELETIRDLRERVAHLQDLNYAHPNIVVLKVVEELDRAMAERDGLKAQLAMVNQDFDSAVCIHEEVRQERERLVTELELITEDRQVEIETRQRLQAELAHAVEVKNRCVATINKLCTQVVELQAQLRGEVMKTKAQYVWVVTFENEDFDDFEPRVYTYDPKDELDDIMQDESPEDSDKQSISCSMYMVPLQFKAGEK